MKRGTDAVYTLVCEGEEWISCFQRFRALDRHLLAKLLVGKFVQTKLKVEPDTTKLVALYVHSSSFRNVLCGPQSQSQSSSQNFFFPNTAKLRPVPEEKVAAPRLLPENHLRPPPRQAVDGRAAVLTEAAQHQQPRRLKGDVAALIKPLLLPPLQPVREVKRSS